MNKDHNHLDEEKVMSEEDKKKDKEQPGHHHDKPLTKDDLIDLLNSKTVESIKKPLIGALNRSGLHPGYHFIKGIGFTALLAAGLIGYYIQWNADIKQRQAEATNRVAEEIQQNINRKIEWQIKLNDSMVSLKENVEMIMLKCKYQIPISEYEKNEERLKSRYKVIEAFTGSQHVFGDKILDKYRDLINFDESVKNLCAPNAPTELEWRKYIIDINNLIAESISQDKKELERLNSFKK